MLVLAPQKPVPEYRSSAYVQKCASQRDSEHEVCDGFHYGLRLHSRGFMLSQGISCSLRNHLASLTRCFGTRLRAML